MKTLNTILLSIITLLLLSDRLPHTSNTTTDNTQTKCIILNPSAYENIRGTHNTTKTINLYEQTLNNLNITKERIILTKSFLTTQLICYR